MSGDDENRFRPKPGRVRSDGGKAGQARSFLSKVRKVTRQQQAASGRSRSAKSGGSGRATKEKSIVASGRGVQRGRGASFVRARNLSNGWSHRQPGSRRVIVKSVPSAARARAERPPRTCAISNATAHLATASAVGSIRRRTIAPTAMPFSIAAKMIAISSASSSRRKTRPILPT